MLARSDGRSRHVNRAYASTQRSCAAPDELVVITFVAGALLLVRNRAAEDSSIVHGSGVYAAQSRDLAPFTGVELSGSNEVQVTVGGEQAVVVSGDENLIDRVTTTVVAGRLVIGNEPGSFTTETPMRVEVTVPSLVEVALSGNGVISVGGIRAEAITVSLSGTGNIESTGVAEQLSIELDGTGAAELRGLVAREVSAVLSGTGRIVVTASSSLDASVPGTGSIVYGGTPAKITRSVTGTGTIVARGR